MQVAHIFDPLLILNVIGWPKGTTPLGLTASTVAAGLSLSTMSYVNLLYPSRFRAFSTFPRGLPT